VLYSHSVIIPTLEMDNNNNDNNRAMLSHYLYIGSLKLGYSQRNIICIVLMHKYLNVIEEKCNNEIWNDNKIILTSALLLLNGKLTENIRTLRDVCSIVLLLYNNHFNCSKINEEYIKIKNLVIEKENFILRVIGFNINIEIPYNNLERMWRYLDIDIQYMRLGIIVLKDCYLPRKCIDINNNILAASSLYISITIINNTINQKEWWTIYDIKESQLLETVTWILTVQQKYSNSNLERHDDNSNVMISFLPKPSH